MNFMKALVHDRLERGKKGYHYRDSEKQCVDILVDAFLRTEYW